MHVSYFFALSLGIFINILIFLVRTETHEYAGMYASLNIDNSFSMKSFKEKFSIEITKSTPEHLTFEMKGIDAALANTFRRIMISEVPTVAIEHVYVNQNTGVLQDEILSHRLGLIPMFIDPDMLEYATANGELNHKNCVRFRLRATGGPSGASKGSPVYSRQLQWVPSCPEEEEMWRGKEPRPVLPDILITKLATNQEIELEVVCVKGVGKTHTKWSPVCTAFYRMEPLITFPKGKITGTDAATLVDLCPKKVFDIEDTVVVAARPKDCSSCRACFEEFPGRVEVNKLKESFMFSVESTGSILPKKIVLDAFRLLAGMCEEVMQLLPTNDEDEEMNV